ncbi:MAG: serine/threonine protein kinase, partial [Myxococcales bacterium]|nr:serine/threonine protein kinase [Myxococcales bacterium]
MIGRYVVLDELGAGSMGVVYAAYDPELDRKVALKLVRPELAWTSGAGDGVDARARILREAQALARLAHPNVVAIHDVGEHRDGVWLAMEFVDGVTLGTWLKEQARSWREVLGVLDAAGRGLVAAHAAGLLHRDFKPENVMVGRDGRVRVMDLGLARSADAATKVDEARPVLRETPSVLSLQVTRVGTLLGTPAYMAPEQLCGLEVDARADVFAFCVTLWRALYGERPFAGDTLEELQANVVGGRRRRPPSGSRVPGWLRGVCERGLEVAPEQRWPSMQALLDALARRRRRSRLTRWALAAGLVAAAGAGTMAYGTYEEAREVAACEAEGASIAEVWSGAAEERVRDGLRGSGVAYASTTADKVMPYLYEQADAWRSARTEACLKGQVERAWDHETMDRAVWCLDERRIALGALVDELSYANESMVQRAVVAVSSVAPVDSCVDAAALAASPAPPPEALRASAGDVLRSLSRATTQIYTGEFDEGLKVARGALRIAEELGWSPLIASARVVECVLLARTNAYAEAEVAGVAAYKEAAKVRAWHTAANAATSLVTIVGFSLARPAEGRMWAEHAEIALALAGDPLRLGEASRLIHLATLHQTAGEHGEAKALNERALAIRTAALGPLHPEVAAAYSNLGLNLRDLADFDQAEVMYERSLAIRTEALGDAHPDIATSLTRLAGLHSDRGEYAEAVALYERAIATQERVFGPEHLDVTNSLNNLATVHQKTGAYAEAAALHERVLATREKALGREHPMFALSLINLGGTRWAMGDLEEARRMFERALDIQEKTLGPEHPQVAITLLNLSEYSRHSGEHARARALLERALTIFEAKLGADHPVTAGALGNLGGIALDEGRPAEALPSLERAVAIFDSHEGVQELELEHRFALARALVETGGDRARALAEARKAADGWRDAGEGRAKERAEVERWI